jgi:ADP-dependent NAD(P)H-hydrate dehydratase / NAD(P)H-hydrate epimerase
MTKNRNTDEDIAPYWPLKVLGEKKRFPLVDGHHHQEALNCFSKEERRLNSEIFALRGLEWLKKEAHEFQDLLFLCGPGINGMETLRLARYAQNIFTCHVFYMTDQERTTPELLEQVRLATSEGMRVFPLDNVEELQSYLLNVKSSRENWGLVDGLLGAGTRLPLGQVLYDFIRFLNNQHFFVLSWDLPSGLCPLTGQSSGAVLVANKTLVIGHLRPIYFLSDGAFFSGDITLNPWPSYEGEMKVASYSEGHFLQRQEMPFHLLVRNAFQHKYQFGNALIIGGSTGLTGAPILAALAGLSSGVGLMALATWEDCYLELASRSAPDMMLGKLPNLNEIQDNKTHSIYYFVEKYDTLGIGPGMVVDARSEQLARLALGHFSGTIVVDAGAISCLRLSQDAELLRLRTGKTIFTPHFGEFARFMEIDLAELQKNPLHYARQFVEKTSTALILKGPCTLLVFPHGEIYYNYFPNHGLAKGGSGDVLCGLITAMLAQYGNDTEWSDIGDVLKLAVWTHSLAGFECVQKYGARSMTAGLLATELGRTLDKLSLLSGGK